MNNEECAYDGGDCCKCECKVRKPSSYNHVGVRVPLNIIAWWSLCSSTRRKLSAPPLFHSWREHNKCIYFPRSRREPISEPISRPRRTFCPKLGTSSMYHTVLEKSIHKMYTSVPSPPCLSTRATFVPGRRALTRLAALTNTAVQTPALTGRAKVSLLGMVLENISDMLISCRWSTNSESA